MCPDSSAIACVHCSAAVVSAAHCCRLRPCGEILSTTSVAPVWSTRARRMELLCEIKLQQLELEQQLGGVEGRPSPSQQTSCARKRCVSELRRCNFLSKFHVISPLFSSWSSRGFCVLLVCSLSRRERGSFQRSGQQTRRRCLTRANENPARCRILWNKRKTRKNEFIPNN